MFNKFKELLGVTPEQKQAREEALNEYKKGLDEELEIFKKESEERLKRQKIVSEEQAQKVLSRIDLQVEQNNKIELQNIVDEYFDKIDEKFNSTLENLETLPKFSKHYISSFEMTCDSYKRQMNLYGEIPEKVLSDIEERLLKLRETVEKDS